MRQSYEFKGNIIPEYIRLPDGRRFLLTDIANKVRKLKNHKIKSFSDNLRYGFGPKGGFKREAKEIGRPSKYTHEDRLWFAAASYEEIMQRYNCTRTFAYSLKSSSKRYVESLETKDYI